MSPRPDVSDERKQQILEAAIAVFARLGFRSARMDDVAEQAGLSKGALYLYYKSKDAIIAALLQRLFAQEFKQLQALVKSEREGLVVEQLLMLTRQFASMMQWMSKLMPIAFEFYAIAGRDKQVRQFLKEYFTDYRRLLARLIERGIAQGEFRDIDAMATAITLTALFEGLALLFFVDPEATRWADQTETSVRLLLSGYNHLGARQDWQAFYEAPATRDLIAHASFETAQAVFEFGCGTGAFAEQVLAHHLPPQATYLAVDSSATMVRLVRSRLARFGERVTVRQTDGTLRFPEDSGQFDRFVSNYVLDLLSASDIALLLAEAHRLLAAEGRLCLVSLTRGATPLARLVTWSWTRIHGLQPRLVGGCRPLELCDYLPLTSFQIDYAQVITCYGVPSEVVVASKSSGEDEAS